MDCNKYSHSSTKLKKSEKDPSKFHRTKGNAIKRLISSCHNQHISFSIKQEKGKATLLTSEKLEIANWTWNNYPFDYQFPINQLILGALDR